MKAKISFFMSGLVESVGNVGIAPRSDGRIVSIAETPVQTLNDVGDLVKALVNEHRKTPHDTRPSVTRLQLKIACDTGLVEDPRIAPHVEGYLRPNTNDPHGVVFLGYNRPRRGSNDYLPSEWQAVQEVWSQEPRITPLERIAKLRDNGHTLTKSLDITDADSLQTIWEPFGWSREGVLSFIESYNKGEAGWFAGVRDEDGSLCAAAKAEMLRLGDTTIIESTEWGTHPDFRKHGYATIAAIALNALILNDANPTETMSIHAEANMADETPGFMVAHRAGFKTMADLATSTPNHVLPQHVSVGGELRNFLLVQLDNEQISKYYQPEVCEQIIEFIR